MVRPVPFTRKRGDQCPHMYLPGTEPLGQPILAKVVARDGRHADVSWLTAADGLEQRAVGCPRLVSGCQEILDLAVRRVAQRHGVGHPEQRIVERNVERVKEHARREEPLLDDDGAAALALVSADSGVRVGPQLGNAALEAFPVPLS